MLSISIQMDRDISATAFRYRDTAARITPPMQITWLSFHLPKNAVALTTISRIDSYARFQGRDVSTKVNLYAVFTSGESNEVLSFMLISLVRIHDNGKPRGC